MSADVPKAAKDPRRSLSMATDPRHDGTQPTPIGPEHGWFAWRYWLARWLYPNPMRDPANRALIERIRSKPHDRHMSSPDTTKGSELKSEPLSEAPNLTQPTEWTPPSADEAFAEYLQKIGKASCPSCGRVMDRGDVSWNNAATSEGTPYTWGQIVCQACGTEVAHWSSWHPGAEDFEEFVENVLPDLEARNGG